MERPSTPQGSNQIFILIGSVRSQLASFPCTVFLLGLILVVPSLLLSASRLTPTLNRRGTAELFDITRRARLVQSFEADPTSPVPQIWQRRLAPDTARDRWKRHGRAVWWLIWLDDGEPVLALPSSSDASSLDLLFADELHRISFDQLPSLESRTPSPLEQNCLQLLTSATAVQWQPAGLASISGALFSSLASVSHGCLRVVLQGDRLMAEGPVASRPFVSLKDAQARGRTKPVRFDASLGYLELNSVALQPLLGSFLNNPLIAEQLTARYGLPQELRDVLIAAPVVLRVSGLDDGRFRASVQARLMLPAAQISNLKTSLDAVSTALLRQGFQREQRPLLMPKGPSPNRFADVWLDPEGDPSGGWSLGPEMQGQVELLLALGEAPTLDQAPMKRHGQQRLRLRSRPNELVRLGWLGPGWPSVIRTASHLELEMTALPKERQPGWLSLQLALP
jgi:hypothetical protein